MFCSCMYYLNSTNILSSSLYHKLSSPVMHSLSALDPKLKDVILSTSLKLRISPRLILPLSNAFGISFRVGSLVTLFRRSVLLFSFGYNMFGVIWISIHKLCQLNIPFLSLLLGNLANPRSSLAIGSHS